MSSPIGYFPSFEEMAQSRPIIEGIMFDLGNREEDYIAGKIASPVAMPSAPRENEMNIDARGLWGRIARMGLWGAFGTARPSKVGKGQRGIPVEGQPFDPVTYESQKLYNTFSIDAETAAELEEFGIDGLAMLIAIPRTQVLVNREAEWAALFGTSGNWTASAAAATAWDQSGATPLTDIQNLRRDVAKSGVRPDTLILSAPVAYQLESLLGYTMSSTSPVAVTQDIVTDEQLVATMKAKFGFDNVFIGNAKTETSTVPNVSVSEWVWGDTVWVGHIGEQLRATSAGNVPAMRQSAVASIIAQPLYADVIGPRIDANNTDCYTARVRMNEALTIVYPQLGGVLTGVLTP